MTDRDIFAAAAMMGIIANKNFDGSYQQVADDAYCMADAMIEHRREWRSKQPRPEPTSVPRPL